MPSGSAIGRVTASGERRYYLKGHLGSVRTVLGESGAAKEARDYYPFGLRLRAGGEMTAAEDFTGHHLDAATGGLLYAGARYYMSALGRWTAPDPLEDDYPAWNPYNYGMNNPTGLVDPTGMAPTDYYLNLAEGKVEYHEGSEDRFDEGLIRLAGDDASVSDITDALDEHGFSYESTQQVDTREQYQGWKMMQIFSPENVGTVLALAATPIETGKAPRQFGTTLTSRTPRSGLPISEKDIGHIFRDASGHLKADTPLNRSIIRSATSRESFRLGTDKFGNTWYARKLSDGRQVWASVRDGQIRYGGVNRTPRTFNSETGLAKARR